MKRRIGTVERGGVYPSTYGLTTSFTLLKKQGYPDGIYVDQDVLYHAIELQADLGILFDAGLFQQGVNLRVGIGGVVSAANFRGT